MRFWNAEDSLQNDVNVVRDEATLLIAFPKFVSHDDMKSTSHVRFLA